MYHVPAVILFNKTDLYGKKELEQLEHFTHMYENTGYRVIAASVKRDTGLDEIHEALKNKTTLISGHSGVGKSSFINAIVPRLNIKTKDVSGWSGKGQHTTTFAEMFDIPDGGRIIDTPGVR
jgi:ribosome biogenesis GTPase